MPRTKRAGLARAGAAVGLLVLLSVGLVRFLQAPPAGVEHEVAPLGRAQEPGADAEGQAREPRLLGRTRPANAERAQAEPGQGSTDAAPALPFGAGTGEAAGQGDAVAVAPGSILDEVRPGALAPLRVPRSELIGAVGAYGRREAIGDFSPRWLGAALVDRTGALREAEDDTLDPLSAAVLGRVVRSDGEPVAGAELILYSSFYLRQSYYDRRVREIGRAYSDGEGRFDLRPIDLDTVHFGRSGDVLMTVRHPLLADLVAQKVGGLSPGRESEIGDLVLPEVGAVVSGTILDLAGNPVVGAVVRASGWMNPVDYDKSERMVVLAACPSATTDAQGNYRLTDFAPGRHEISVHVNLDCVAHQPGQWQGESTWSLRVRAGHGIVGRVVDEWGEPVAAAVVYGGGNWTPSYADGTFWLDNVDEGALRLEVLHHAYARHAFSEVLTDQEDPVVLRLTRRLARVTLRVVDPTGRPVPLVEVEWTWAASRGPDEFTPRSPRWHDPGGIFKLVIPDGVIGARVWHVAVGEGVLTEAELSDGSEPALTLQPPPVLHEPEEGAR